MKLNSGIKVNTILSGSHYTLKVILRSLYNIPIHVIFLSNSIRVIVVVFVLLYLKICSTSSDLDVWWINRDAPLFTSRSRVQTSVSV